MTKSKEFVVNFVARGRAENEWLVVLVEEGPLTATIDDFLSNLQDRLYNAIDAVIDGQLAKKFPESQGKDVVIRLDCYNLPKSEINDFFLAFSAGVLNVDDYKKALESSKFVMSIRFEVNFDNVV